MEGGTRFNEDRDLLTGQQDGDRSRVTDGDSQGRAHARTGAGGNKLSRSSSVRLLAALRPNVALNSWSPAITDSRRPGLEQPGFFLTKPNGSPTATEVQRRKIVDRVHNTRHFHDRESLEEDVYDLYNACNGVLDINGYLDVEQLKQFSPDEAEELNVSRLRVVWEHTATGCPRCAEIIETLNTLRKALRERAGKSSEGKSGDDDINDIYSIS